MAWALKALPGQPHAQPAGVRVWRPPTVNDASGSGPSWASPRWRSCSPLSACWPSGQISPWWAVAQASPEHEAMVRAAVAALLQPWLDDTAKRFQAAVQNHGLPAPADQAPIRPRQVAVCCLPMASATTWPASCRRNWR